MTNLSVSLRFAAVIAAYRAFAFINWELTASEWGIAPKLEILWAASIVLKSTNKNKRTDILIIIV